MLFLDYPLADWSSRRLAMAEGMGFEPMVACATTVFKTAPINRSGTPPRGARFALYHTTW